MINKEYEDNEKMLVASGYAAATLIDMIGEGQYKEWVKECRAGLSPEQLNQEPCVPFGWPYSHPDQQ